MSPLQKLLTPQDWRIKVLTHYPLQNLLKDQTCRYSKDPSPPPRPSIGGKQIKKGMAHYANLQRHILSNALLYNSMETQNQHALLL